MNFFKKLGKSIYGPEFYRDLTKQPVSYSIKYIILFSLLFAVLATTKFSIVALPELNSAISQIGPAVVSSFPEELEVTLKGGKVSTNVEEPYFIKFPASWKTEENKKDAPENLIVIDTKSEPSASTLKKYDTTVLIAEQYLVYEQENGKITSISLGKVPDSVIDKGYINNLSNKYSPYLKILLPMMTVFVFIAALVYIPLRLVYLIIAALFIWLIAKIKKVPIGYGKSYQLGMHLITLPIIIVTIVPLKFLFFFTILLVITAVINIREFEEENLLLASEPNPIPNQAREISKANPPSNENSPVDPNIIH